MCKIINKYKSTTTDWTTSDDDNISFILIFFLLYIFLYSLPQNELQMALPNIDLSKLSKLRQRLVAPSLFSTQYLFPGNQAFFRDFIICCDFHSMFIEQLKIALISELLQMNDSSIETLCITHGNVNNNTAASTTNDDDNDNKEKNLQQEFIVSLLFCWGKKSFLL